MSLSFAFRLPPAIGKATAGGKTAKRQHGMWEKRIGEIGRHGETKKPIPCRMAAGRH